MMFASKTPRDLNHDPKPWLFISDQVFGELRSDHDKGYHDVSGTWWAFSPRPEFDHVQHNKPNPILVDVRRYAEERKRMNQPKGWIRVLRVFSAAADYGHFVTGDWEKITSPEMLEHARRVLTRLARLAEVAS